MELKVLNRNKNVVNTLKSTMKKFFTVVVPRLGVGQRKEREREKRERKKRNKNSTGLPNPGSSHPFVMANRSALSVLSKLT